MTLSPEIAELARLLGAAAAREFLAEQSDDPEKKTPRDQQGDGAKEATDAEHTPTA